MTEHMAECQPWQAAVSCRDPSPARLRGLRDAGIRLIEVLPPGVQQLPAEQRPAHLRQIADVVRESGLGVWSVHIPFGGGWDISVVAEGQRAGAMDNVRGLIEFCQLLRPHKAIVHPSAEPIADDQRPQRLRASRRSLEQLAAEFAAAGVQLAVENLPRTCLGNTAEEMLQLVDGIPHLGICFDTNHLLKQTHEQFLSQTADRIVSMHCSDYDGIDERHWLPGEGIVPWAQVRSMLMQAGYGGPFLFEAWMHRDGKPIQREEYGRRLQELAV